MVRLPDGTLATPRPLPCWYDDFLARKEASRNSEKRFADSYTIEPPELFMSVVVPAYNEEKRMEIMLEEAVEFLDKEYAGKKPSSGQSGATTDTSGYEILIVSDGSKDDTTGVALRFSQKHGLFEPSAGGANRSIRVIELEQNRGKGGAVVHGMRHVRGAYAVFADADGASRFHDLGKLVEACARVQDKDGRAVGIGSRAHLVGSEEVVKVSYFLEGTALYLPAQRLDARIPCYPSPHDTTKDSSDWRHTVRLQALHPPCATVHHSIHA